MRIIQRTVDLIHEALNHGYKVDIQKGIVYSKRGHRLKGGLNHNRGKYRVLQIYINGKKHGINESTFIAVAGGLDVVGKRIGHVDGDNDNNKISNLFVIEPK